jgi:hypothetical protein
VRNMDRLAIDLILSVSFRVILHLKMTIQFILRIAKNYGVLPLNFACPQSQVFVIESPNRRLQMYLRIWILSNNAELGHYKDKL